MLSTKTKSEIFLASCLHDALEDTDLGQITVLLKNKGADPNILIPCYGISPFHMIVGNKSEKFAEEITKLFLRHKGNPNVKASDGMTPVHVAAALGRVKILELLLANGGDPFCLDNHKQTPFHYALEGPYHDVIAVLGKYSAKNPDGDDDSSSEDDIQPKVEIKLEKILVNKGNLIAEYVLSDIERSSNDTLVSDDKKSINKENLDENYKIGNRSTPTKPISTDKSDDDNSPVKNFYLNEDNITHRRPRKGHKSNSNAISPILPVQDDCDSNVLELNKNREKSFKGKLNSRLLSPLNQFDELNNINENNSKSCKKKFTSLIPQPKIYKNNLRCMEKKKPSVMLDNSIISKSPNLRISSAKFIKRKTPPSLNSNKHLSYKNKNIKMKSCNNPSSKSPSIKIKSASSTPRKRINRVYNGSAETASLKSKININKITTLLNKTYSESDYDIPYSLGDEENHNAVSGRALSKNVVRKLDGSYNEDYGTKIKTINNNKTKIKQELVSRTPVNGKSIKLKNPVSKDIKSVRTELLEQLKTPKAKILDENQYKNGVSPIKKEKCYCFFRSPGSSNPTSVNSSFKSNLEPMEEIKLFDELQEIYQTKGQTPPASLSNSINITSTSFEESIESSKNTDLIFFDCEGINSKKQPSDHLQSSKEICTTLEQKFTFDSQSDIFRTPMRSIASSRCSNESFVSVDEEYAYVDVAKNVAFLERRLRVIPVLEDMDDVKHESTWLDKLAELSINSYAASSKQSSRVGKETIGNNTLRNKLISLGIIPGPITHTTYNVYIKHLRKLEQKVNLNDRLEIENSHDEIPKISKIPLNILTTDWMSDIEQYQDLEDQVFGEYKKLNPSKKYRGGVGTTSFNYLLLDPRITKDLPRTGRNLSQSDRWKRFLEAIFYVGKGKAARPAAHLYDAFDIWIGKKQVDEPSEKIQKIINIWREGRGVVCLHVFMNTMQEEAFTREAAMIDALGTIHLSNCNRGNYYGILSTMSNQEKKSLGKYLLYKAMEIFMLEGERQIFPKSMS